MRAHGTVPPAQALQERGRHHVVHEGRLARARDARHAGHGAQRDARVDTLQVVRPGVAHVQPQAVALPPRARHRRPHLSAQALARQAAAVAQQLVVGPLEDHAASLLAGARTQVDHVVGLGHDGAVVLHHEHGVALVAQRLQHADEALGVRGVQADGRLVEHVQRAPQPAAERAREGDALGLAARQARERAVERQVPEPDVGQELQPPQELGAHALHHRRVALLRLPRRKEHAKRVDGQRRQLLDVPLAHEHGARLVAQPPALAGRARLVPAVAAQEDADLHLVLLRLQRAEEADDAGELLVALEDGTPVLLRQVLPGDVHRDAAPPREALQLRAQGPIVRAVPRLDRAVGERAGGIGYDERLVDLDQVPEAVAGRTGAARAVEGEELRLGLLVRARRSPGSRSGRRSGAWGRRSA